MQFRAFVDSVLMHVHPVMCPELRVPSIFKSVGVTRT